MYIKTLNRCIAKCYHYQEYDVCTIAHNRGWNSIIAILHDITACPI